MLRILYIALLLLVLTMGCGRRDMTADRLDAIDSLCGTDPRRAVAMLDSIDRGSLPEKDRHRLDLLTVKSRDKAYIRHTSDSLILDAIDYYSGHRKEGLYPEALYYGGRVYSDLGDLPTALGYFQKALNEIPYTDMDIRLRSSMLSQTGRLLEELRLHDDAKEYVMKAIACSKQINDSLNIFYDNMLLAHIFFRMNDVRTAKHHIDEATAYSAVADSCDRVWLEALWVKSTLMDNNADSAVKAVRRLSSKADSMCWPFVVSVSSQAYRNAGILDTAYRYAYDLIHDNDPEVSKSGFQLIFSDSLSQMIPLDSMVLYAKAYRSSVDSSLSRLSRNNTLLRNSEFIHSDFRKARTLSSRLTVSVIALVVILLVMFIFFMCIFKKKDLSLKESLCNINGLEGSLQNAEDTISALQCELTEARETITGIAGELDCIKNDDAYALYEEEQKKSRRKKDLLDQFFDSTPQSHGSVASPEIKESCVYREVLDRLESGKGIPDRSDIWNKIDVFLAECYPDMKSRLETLTEGRMTEIDYRMACLIKLGFTPVQTSVICNVTKSTISSRRNKLCRLVFTKEESLKLLDELVRWL